MPAGSLSATVHPRVCGEQFFLPHQPRLRNGSSPRVRGTATRGIEMGTELRFIPACAGNSRDTVHYIVSGRGSSPRVRGTARLEIAVGPVIRFIPACAGNSPSKSG